MNIDNLHKLQILTKNLSLLYVENSQILQKQIGGFVDTIFQNVYQAYDGEDGIEQFMKFSPDVILTDLTMPIKDGVEMIMNIRADNPDITIIVLSHDNDDVELLQTIDLNISEFLIKPLDINKLISTLLKVTKKKPTLAEQECLDELEKAYCQKSTLNFQNDYKGIFIQNKGQIVKFNQDEFIVKIPPIQIATISYEKHTTMQLNLSNKYIKVDLLYMDIVNHTLTLTNPKYIKHFSKDMKKKRLFVDKSFKVGLHYLNKQIQAQAIDINFASISIIISAKSINLSVGNEIDLAFGFQIKAKSSLVYDDIITKALAKGKILQIKSYPYGTKIVVSMRLAKSSQSTLMKYLKQREIETIKELKKLVQM